MKMKRVRIALLMVLSAVVVATAIVVSGCSKSQTGNSTAVSSRPGFSVSNYKQMLDNNLASLVSDGTITSDQEDKIISAIADEMSSRMATMSRPSGTYSRPSGSRPSGSGQWSGSRPSGSGSGRMFGGGQQYTTVLSGLVSNGTITQAQSDAVLKALSGGYNASSAAQGS